MESGKLERTAEKEEEERKREVAKYKQVRLEAGASRGIAQKGMERSQAPSQRKHGLVTVPAGTQAPRQTT